MFLEIILLAYFSVEILTYLKVSLIVSITVWFPRVIANTFLQNLILLE